MHGVGCFNLMKITHCFEGNLGVIYIHGMSPKLVTFSNCTGKALDMSQ